MSHCLANVILAFSWPYYMLLYGSLGVLFVEVKFFKWYQQGRVSLGRSIVMVTTANIASFLVGYLALPYMPTGVGPHGIHTAQFPWLVNLAFAWAFGSSWVTELLVIMVMSRGLSLRRPVACVGMMNGISYAVLWGPFALNTL